MFIFADNETKYQKDDFEAKSDDDKKKVEEGRIVGILFGFVFVPLLFFITTIAAFIAFQYCMTYNVVFYTAKEDIGMSWTATIWKFMRVIRDAVLCRKGNRDTQVLVQLSLDDVPPITELLDYVYGDMSDALCAQAHTVNHLMNDGLIGKSDAPKIDIV
jgi:hypothetical protein